MNRINRRKFKRKETINTKLAIQIVISIILVVVVIIMKKVDNSYTDKLLKQVDLKISSTINYKNIVPKSKEIFYDVAGKLSNGMIYDKDEAVPVLSGKVVKSFVLNKEESDENYNGMDIISKTESIKSISDGIIYSVGNSKKYSNFVVQKNQNTIIIYAKLAEVFVKKGDTIKKGSLIGRLEDKNKIFHIEVWKDGKSINPTNLFKLDSE